MRGGRIRSNDSAGMKRGIRKRLQIQACYYLLETIIHQRNEDESTHRRHPPSSSKELTIIDAGCGAGNLAISLAGLLVMSKSDIGRNVHILAVDINEVALDLLSQRAAASLDVNIVQTLCADLSDDHERILSHIPIDNDVVVMSLHACGAASDYAMELAYRCKASFIVCPCCTAKSLTRRDTNNGDTTTSSWLLSSTQRSGSSVDIEYPRSVWLRDRLSSMQRQVSTLIDTEDDDNKLVEESNDSASMDDDDGNYYSILAKVADVGLGPQTPSKQRVHQRRAKRIVELDRAMRAVEQHGYDVHLVRLPDDDPWGYGKGEVMVGMPYVCATATGLGIGTILSSEHINSDD
jgi:hypothetical protein